MFIKNSDFLSKKKFFRFESLHFISNGVEIKQLEEFIKIKIPEDTFIFILSLEKNWVGGFVNRKNKNNSGLIDQHKD